MKSNLKVLLFLTLAFWCVNATNLDSIFEISDTYQSFASDTKQDEKLKDFEMKYNFKLKYIFFMPNILESIVSNYGISHLFFHNVCIEVNAPPPDYQA